VFLLFILSNLLFFIKKTETYAGFAIAFLLKKLYNNFKNFVQNIESR